MERVTVSPSSALKSIQKVDLCILILLGVLGLGLRLAQLWGNLYCDEIWIVNTAASSFPDFLEEVKEDWVHPPLFHFLVRASVGLFGQSEMVGRFLSILFGTLSIPLLYWLGREISGVAAGLVAGTLLALAPVHIYHSVYGRHYSMFLFLVIVTMLAFNRIIRDRSWRSAVVYFLAAVLLVYTHYFGWLILLAQGVLLLIADRRTFPRWAAVAAVVVVSYAPWIWAVAGTVAGERSDLLIPHIAWIPPPSFNDVIQTVAAFNGEVSRNTRKIGLLLFGSFILLSLTSLCRRPRDESATGLLLLYVLVPFGVVYVASHILQPLWILRGMIISVPAYYLLVALGSREIDGGIFQRQLKWMPIAWMGAASFFYIAQDHRMPFEEIVQYLEMESAQEAPILVENPYIMNPIFWYYKGNGRLYELRSNNLSIIPASRRTAITRHMGQAENLIVVTYSPMAEKETQSQLLPLYKFMRQKVFFGYGEEGQRRRVCISFYRIRDNVHRAHGME